MKVRVLVTGVLVLVLLLGLSGTVSAQSKRVIKIALSSWKFEPDIIKFDQGDTVVLQLANIDPQRPHNIASSYLNTVDFAIRGCVQANADAFSGSQSHRGKSQIPVAGAAERRETEISEAR